MRRSHWLLVVFVGGMVCSGNCRPREVADVFPVYRSVKELETPNSSPSSTSGAEAAKAESENASKANAKLNIEAIATVARASSDGPSVPSSAALGHVLDTVSQMVESDIRTPPKLKEIMKEKTNDHRKDPLGEHSTPLPYTFIYDEEVGRLETTERTLLLDSSEGKASHVEEEEEEGGVKGVAIPVVMDEDLEGAVKKLEKVPEVPRPEKKKNPVTKWQPTTTPSSGLSTWILLSDNKDLTTPSPKKNGGKREEEKKKGPGTTTKKPGKVQATTQKATTTQTIKKVTKKPEAETTAMSALEALVKNQKKGAVGSSTAKPNSKKPSTDPKKKFPDRLQVAESKDKVEVQLPESIPLPLQANGEDKAAATTSSEAQSPTTTENPTESTTKKKSATKKKKKNKNRRKKPSEATGVEAKIPPQAVGSQIYNFLSREIVPTVGLGLIGVALTAGLASFLGYNPFGSSTIPLRRTYDTHHGYTPNSYYNYNTDYGGGGQSEEVLFREVLSGMPEESRYDLTRTDSTYPEAYNRQDQMYDGAKGPVYPTGVGYSADKDIASYDASYPQDYSTGYGNYDGQDKYSTEVSEKYPVYTRETGTSFVYPETTGMTSAEKASRTGDDHSSQSIAAEKYSKPETIERQPEALYRVAGESEVRYGDGESTVQGVTGQGSWHRIGAPMEAKKSYPLLEPGPRSLDVDKEAKKRSKRAAESVIQRISRKRIKKENDVENEIDFEDPPGDEKFPEQALPKDSSTAAAAEPATTPPATTTASPTSTTTEDAKEASQSESTETFDGENESAGGHPGGGVSVLDVLKRLAQFKLRLGLNFLRSTTDLFSRYLDDIQRRVDESFANTTTTTTVQYNRRKSPWSRIFFSRLNDPEEGEESYRRKRSVLEENHLLSAMLSDESKDRFPKSTKKELRLSNKVFHQKKHVPKKFESKRGN